MQITKTSPRAAILLDLTRTVRRAGLRPTGIDRIERAYLEHFITQDAPLFGIVRTKLGYLLLDKPACMQLSRHCVTPIWTSRDRLSNWSRHTQEHRAITESGLRQIARARALPIRLGAMLKTQLPGGAIYINLGQTNLTDRMIHSVRAAGARLVVYVHDTIPLDWPDLQTAPSQDKFRHFFQKADRWSDLILCNSADTKSRILSHATHLRARNVHVLKPGLPQMDIGIAPRGPWSERPYFMAIGTIEPRKRIGFLLDLWEDFAKKDDPQLVICGRRGWMSEDVFARLDANPANVHELNDLDDPALWALLQASNGQLFPSCVEGFGYPAIEAAAVNVPLICTPLPVFQEVLGDYPIYADATERYIWRNKIEQLAQRRRGQSGEQDETGGFTAPTWQAHFNQLFTLL